MKCPKFFTISAPDSVFFELHGLIGNSVFGVPASSIFAEATAGKRWTDFGVFFPPVVCISDAVKVILSALPDAPTTEALRVTRVTRRLASQARPVYHWFEPAARIDTQNLGAGPTSALISSSEIPRELFYRNRQAQGYVFCDLRLVKLARQHNWTELQFRPIDVPPSSFHFRWEGNYLSQVWPPVWWPTDHTPPIENVVEVDGVENWFTGCAASEPCAQTTSRRLRSRRPTPDTCLISLADVQALKFRVEDQGYDTELTAEVPLNRPLYDSDTLDISVVIEDEDNVPKSSQITEAVQSILKLFERVLPEIEKRVRAQFELGDPAQTEGLLAGLHSPSLLFTAHELASPIRWSFVVEGEPMAVHVEFERLDIVEVWASD